MSMAASMPMGGGAPPLEGANKIEHLEEIAATMSDFLGDFLSFFPGVRDEFIPELVQIHPAIRGGVFGAEPDPVGFALSPGGLIGAVGALNLVIGHGVRPIGKHIDPDFDQSPPGHLAEHDTRFLIFINIAAGILVVMTASATTDFDDAITGHPPVSYTHLTLPTNREV